MLSKTGRMELMARMTGRPQHYPARRMPLVTPGFVQERDRHPAPFNALARAAGLIRDLSTCVKIPDAIVDGVIEAAELRERFPDADVPEEVRGGFLIPPVYIETLPTPPEELDYVKALEIERKFKEKYQGKPKGDPIMIPESATRKTGGTLNSRPLPVFEATPNLSPREEALLREAPVFRLSPIEPQPDVVVIPPKENQC